MHLCYFYHMQDPNAGVRKAQYYFAKQDSAMWQQLYPVQGSGWACIGGALTLENRQGDNCHVNLPQGFIHTQGRHIQWKYLVDTGIPAKQARYTASTLRS